MSISGANILPDMVRAAGVVKNFAKDAILHHQEDVFNHIIYVQSGRVFASSLNIDGDETWVAEHGAGHFMGCTALFGAKPTVYQLTTKTPVTAVLFPRETFLALMEKHAEFGQQVIADMSRQISVLTLQKIESTSLSVQGRIAAELFRQAKPIGREPDTYIIRPTPVFSELAQRLGSTRETVSRAVSKMVKNNVLERRTGALLVGDMDRLEDQIA